MASHPYISGAGNIAQMIGFLRKNFPASVTSETVKKFSLAPNNESYVINALQFIGVIDQEGKRTDKGHQVLLLPQDEFQSAFSGLVKEAYADLFEIRGEEAWTMTKQQLTAYFRTTDKTSEIIGSRQAAVFSVFRALSGYEELPQSGVTKQSGVAKPTKAKAAPAPKGNAANTKKAKAESLTISEDENTKRDMALTVRIEINLPAGGTKETYDNIFKSIRANLIDS